MTWVWVKYHWNHNIRAIDMSLLSRNDEMYYYSRQIFGHNMTFPYLLKCKLPRLQLFVLSKVHYVTLVHFNGNPKTEHEQGLRGTKIGKLQRNWQICESALLGTPVSKRNWHLCLRQQKPIFSLVTAPLQCHNPLPSELIPPIQCSKQYRTADCPSISNPLIYK